jgi:uncharacterized membrane protein YfbV (UPF0208 family)
VDPIFTSIGSIVALLVGAYLKRKPDFAKKFIPIVTFVISLLTQIVAAGTAEAGIFDGVVKGFGNIFINALLQALLTTGAHSAGKNVAQGLKGGR